MNGWTARDMPDQSGKVVIITGANSGLGYESTLALAKKGAHVVMACRNMEKAEAAHQHLLSTVPKASIDIIQLDLANLETIRNFARTFNARYERLDILINNAGIMSPPYSKTVDGFESQLATNHLGHFALTGLVLSKIIQTPSSRVVTVTSSAYAMNARINFDDLQSEKKYVPFAAYGQSKLATVLFMMELQRKFEAAEADSISLAIHPGYVRTKLALQPRNAVEKVFVSIFEFFASQSPAEGATYQLYAATARNVKGADFYGPSRMLIGDVKKLNLSKRAKDPTTAARLWEVSEDLTGVHYEALKQSALP